MTSLPTIDSPTMVTESNLYDTDYHYSVVWDYDKGDFVRDGNNNMVKADGYEAYRTWCIKTVLTERYKCMAYPNEIGAELDTALQQENNEAVEAMLRRTITDAIMVNPRTEDVRNFEFSWDGDEIRVTFLVVPTLRAPFTISV